MAGDRRATAGNSIANRRIEKVFAADELSGVAIAGAAGPAVEMVRLFQVQLDTTRRSRASRSPRGQGQPARAAGARQPPGGDAGLRRRPALRRATTNAAAAAASSATTPPAASTKRPTSRPTARAASTPATGSRPSGARTSTRDDAVDLALRVAVRRRRRGRRHRRPRPGAPHLPDRRGDRRRRVSSCSPTTTSPRRAEALLGGREEGSRAVSMPVLRPARADDEGPRGLRAEGHRPRSQPRRVQRAEAS